jgi:hypothetical protein
VRECVPAIRQLLHLPRKGRVNDARASQRVEDVPVTGRLRQTQTSQHGIPQIQAAPGTRRSRVRQLQPTLDRRIQSSERLDSGGIHRQLLLEVAAIRIQ